MKFNYVQNGMVDILSTYTKPELMLQIERYQKENRELTEEVFKLKRRLEFYESGNRVIKRVSCGNQIL